MRLTCGTGELGRRAMLSTDMIPIQIIFGWFYVLVFIGICIALAAVVNMITLIPLYNDLIMKMHQEHPEVYDRMRSNLPEPAFFFTGAVDTAKFIDFLDNDHEELSPRTMQAKRKYQTAYGIWRKIFIYWVLLLLSIFASILVTFCLAVVFKVVKE